MNWSFSETDNWHLLYRQCKQCRWTICGTAIMTVPSSSTSVSRKLGLSWEGAASALQLRSSPATLNLNAALSLFVLFCVIVVLVCLFVCFCPCRSWPLLCYCCCLFVCLFVCLFQPEGHFLRFSPSRHHRATIVVPNHYNMINAMQRNSGNARNPCNKQTYKQCSQRSQTVWQYITAI